MTFSMFFWLGNTAGKNAVVLPINASVFQYNSHEPGVTMWSNMDPFDATVAAAFIRMIRMVGL